MNSLSRQLTPSAPSPDDWGFSTTSTVAGRSSPSTIRVASSSPSASLIAVSVPFSDSRANSWRVMNIGYCNAEFWSTVSRSPLKHANSTNSEGISSSSSSIQFGPPGRGGSSSYTRVSVTDAFSWAVGVYLLIESVAETALRMSVLFLRFISTSAISSGRSEFSSKWSCTSSKGSSSVE